MAPIRRSGHRSVKESKRPLSSWLEGGRALFHEVSSLFLVQTMLVS
jgi:hypothetical protein